MSIDLTTKGKSFSYRFNPLANSQNKKLALLVTKGDTLIKKSGDSLITIKKETGNQKEFLIRFLEQTSK